MAAVTAQRDQSQWLVGTTALREENEVHRITLLSDHSGDNLVCNEIFPHKYEVWDIAPSPVHENAFFTVYNTGARYEASLWQVVEQDQDQQRHGDSEGGNGADVASRDPNHMPRQHRGGLKQVFTTGGDEPNARKICWSTSDGENTSTSSSSDEVCVMSQDRITIWNLSDGKTSGATSAGSDLVGGITAMAWHPQNHRMICAAHGDAISCVDARTMDVGLSIPSAHGDLPARDVDLSRTNPNVMVSGGDDCQICLWDLRMTDKPRLKIGAAHSHWVWQTRFNPFHDNLIVSGGSDSLVQLWNVPKDYTGSGKQGGHSYCDKSEIGLGWVGEMCTNARFILWFDRFNPFHDNLIVSGGSDSLVQLWNVPKDEGDADDGDEPQPQPQTYDEHEDSVYGIAW
eukprot:CAMPEP_0198247548 /NCGR_PEP_ID=MMETSP1446-20131203/46531_1 /TAXON_ID=1461542 ORGANISM="Unidentified sp, Strain CCMP2111" /NCGR_SAMPLE_ID=MMETSP1446 /ASSEMBLY_ACC=CAM_ASM_001112 /LENGTH=398 /DNA_ID=CAMNT_0043931873 /DNA_START=36 /DNA_END=1230 /DNA_ORIENTATION=+